MASLFDIPITKIASDLGIKKVGDKKYRCFNHGKEDKSPSLILYDPGWFKCMSCHIEGSRYELVQYKLKLKDKKEARAWLNKQYGIKAASEKDKLHVRFIQNSSPKEEHRFTFLPESELFLREPTDTDIVSVKQTLGKAFTLPVLNSLGIKFADNLGRSKWTGIVFRSNLKNRGILYNPKNKEDYLHLEGRTDYIAAGEMGLNKRFALVSDYNKTSFTIFKQKLNVFILDADTEKEFILEKITDECDVKFIRLPEKDLSDFYNKYPDEAEKELIKLINKSETIQLIGDGQTIDDIIEQLNEDLIQKKHAELEPTPIISLGKHILLSQGNIGLIAGSEGVMKSTFARMIVAGAIKHEKAKTWMNFADIHLAQNNGKAVLFFDSEQSKHKQGKNLKEILKRSRNEDVPSNFYSLDFVSKSPDEFIKRFNAYVKVCAKINKGVSLIVIDQLGDMLANINDIAEVKVLMNMLRAISRDYECGILGVIHFNPRSEKERGHIGTELRQKAEMNVNIKRDDKTGISELHIRKAREANEWDIPIMLFGFNKEKFMVVDHGSRARNQNEGEHFSTIVREMYKTREEVGLTNTDLRTYFQEKGLATNKNQFNKILKKMVDRYDVLRKEGDGRDTRYFMHDDVLLTTHKNEEINWEK